MMIIVIIVMRTSAWCPTDHLARVAASVSNLSCAPTTFQLTCSAFSDCDYDDHHHHNQNYDYNGNHGDEFRPALQLEIMMIVIRRQS